MFVIAELKHTCTNVSVLVQANYQRSIDKVVQIGEMSLLNTVYKQIKLKVNL